MAARHSSRRPPPAEPGGDRDLGPEADPAAVARAIVLRKLAAQPQSRRQLADALAAKHVPDDVADMVLGRCEEVGLIDDAAFAETWVRSRQSARGLSRRALRDELRRKGIDEDVIVEAVAAIDPAAEVAAARRLVQRRLRGMEGLDHATKTRRLAGMLARRGYPPGVALSVVSSALPPDGSLPATLGGATPPADYAVAGVDGAGPMTSESSGLRSMSDEPGLD